jgi:hypothetical protein
MTGNPLVDALIVLAVAGVVVYLFNTLVQMDGRFKSAINAIVGLVAFILIVIFLYHYFSGHVAVHR